MSTYRTNVTLNNNTNCALALNTSKSSGIDTNVWPTTLNPCQQDFTFQQGFNFQIKFDAYYDAVGMDGVSVGFHFYSDTLFEHSCNIIYDSNHDFGQSEASYSGEYANVSFTVAGPPGGSCSTSA
jgi:hypothetical protein